MASHSTGRSNVAAFVPEGTYHGQPPIALHRPVMLIGSRQKAHIFLNSRSVSKAHALLVNVSGRYLLRDLSSRTHTIVNGRPVHEVELRDSDKVQIGRYVFRFTTNGQPPSRVISPRAPKAQLEINGRKPIALSERITLIGKRSTSNVSLTDETVSTAHAAIINQSGRWFIRDLGSRSGTFVNGDPVHSVELQFGDTLKIGETQLLFTEFTEQAVAADIDELEHLVGTAPIIDGDDNAQLPKVAQDAVEATRPLPEAISPLPATRSPRPRTPVPEPHVEAPDVQPHELDVLDLEPIEDAVPEPAPAEETTSPAPALSAEDTSPASAELEQPAASFDAVAEDDPDLAKAMAEFDAILAEKEAPPNLELDLERDPDVSGSGDTRQLRKLSEDTVQRPQLSDLVVEGGEFADGSTDSAQALHVSEPLPEQDATPVANVDVPALPLVDPPVDAADAGTLTVADDATPLPLDPPAPEVDEPSGSEIVSGPEPAAFELTIPDDPLSQPRVGQAIVESEPLALADASIDSEPVEPPQVQEALPLELSDDGSSALVPLKDEPVPELAIDQAIADEALIIQDAVSEDSSNSPAVESSAATAEAPSGEPSIVKPPPTVPVKIAERVPQLRRGWWGRLVNKLNTASEQIEQAAPGPSPEKPPAPEVAEVRQLTLSEEGSQPTPVTEELVLNDPDDEPLKPIALDERLNEAGAPLELSGAPELPPGDALAATATPVPELNLRDPELPPTPALAVPETETFVDRSEPPQLESDALHAATQPDSASDAGDTSVTPAPPQPGRRGRKGRGGSKQKPEPKATAAKPRSGKRAAATPPKAPNAPARRGARIQPAAVVSEPPVEQIIDRTESVPESAQSLHPEIEPIELGADPVEPLSDSSFERQVLEFSSDAPGLIIDGDTASAPITSTAIPSTLAPVESNLTFLEPPLLSLPELQADDLHFDEPTRESATAVDASAAAISFSQLLHPDDAKPVVAPVAGDGDEPFLHSDESAGPVHAATVDLHASELDIRLPSSIDASEQSLAPVSDEKWLEDLQLAELDSQPAPVETTTGGLKREAAAPVAPVRSTVAVEDDWEMPTADDMLVPPEPEADSEETNPQLSNFVGGTSLSVLTLPSAPQPAQANRGEPEVDPGKTDCAPAEEVSAQLEPPKPSPRDAQQPQQRRKWHVPFAATPFDQAGPEIAVYRPEVLPKDVENQIVHGRARTAFDGLAIDAPVSRDVDVFSHHLREKAEPPPAVTPPATDGSGPSGNEGSPINWPPAAVATSAGTAGSPESVARADRPPVPVIPETIVFTDAVRAPRRRRFSLRWLLPTMLVTMGATSAAIWFLMPRNDTVLANITYNRLGQVTEQVRREVRAGQEAQLTNPEVREQAFTLLSTRYPGTKGGFLASQTGAVPTDLRRSIRWTMQTDGQGVMTLSLASTDSDDDQKRLKALLQAINTANARLVDEAARASQRVEDLADQVAQANRAIEQLNSQIAEAIRVNDQAPAFERIKELEQQVSGLERELDDARLIARVAETQLRDQEAMLASANGVTGDASEIPISGLRELLSVQKELAAIVPGIILGHPDEFNRQIALLDAQLEDAVDASEQSRQAVAQQAADRRTQVAAQQEQLAAAQEAVASVVGALSQARREWDEARASHEHARDLAHRRMSWEPERDRLIASRKQLEQELATAKAAADSVVTVRPVSESDVHVQTGPDHRWPAIAVAMGLLVMLSAILGFATAPVEEPAMAVAQFPKPKLAAAPEQQTATA